MFEDYKDHSSFKFGFFNGVFSRTVQVQGTTVPQTALSKGQLCFYDGHFNRLFENQQPQISIFNRFFSKPFKGPTVPQTWIFQLYLLEDISNMNFQQFFSRTCQGPASIRCEFLNRGLHNDQWNFRRGGWGRPSAIFSF